ncbi:MAG: GNAT family N-acetyltransferase [Bacteriovorax sp.]|nr:GNAT family N-acetyltransferase [Bacteriovorax sp.]
MKLYPLSQAEYEFWKERSVREYKLENMRANGLTEKEADEKATADFNRYLPDGMKSIDQYIYTMKDSDELVGFLWFCERGSADNRKAYVLDIIIEEPKRGLGYGKKSMLLLEEKVKAMGLKHIGLHVFGHNQRAIGLYQSLNYQTTNLVMEKELK